MYPFQEDVDEDLPEEIVTELEARDRMRATVNDDDEAVFSDVVQDAFKKYQNEVSKKKTNRSLIYVSVVFLQYSKYWTQNETVFCV